MVSMPPNTDVDTFGISLSSGLRPRQASKTSDQDTDDLTIGSQD